MRLIRAAGQRRLRSQQPARLPQQAASTPQYSAASSRRALPAAVLATGAHEVMSPWAAARHSVLQFDSGLDNSCRGISYLSFRLETMISLSFSHRTIITVPTPICPTLAS